jgi:hypothetical protein
MGYRNREIDNRKEEQRVRIESGAKQSVQRVEGRGSNRESKYFLTYL